MNFIFWLIYLRNLLLTNVENDAELGVLDVVQRVANENPVELVNVRVCFRWEYENGSDDWREIYGKTVTFFN